VWWKGVGDEIYSLVFLCQEYGWSWFLVLLDWLREPIRSCRGFGGEMRALDIISSSLFL